MNISVNFASDVPVQPFGHRSATTQQAQSSDKAVQAADATTDVNKANIAREINTQPDELASSKMELQANNKDYKIKMLIERPAGTTTLKTELNFYKKNPQQAALMDEHNVDLLA